MARPQGRHANMTAGTIGRALAIAAGAFLSLAPDSAGATSCEWAMRFTSEIIENAQRAITDENYVVARRAASDTRTISIDAAREAKACGCPAAIASLEKVAEQAIYALNAQNLTATQQYGRKIKAYGEEALDTLIRCPGN